MAQKYRYKVNFTDDNIKLYSNPIIINREANLSDMDELVLKTTDTTNLADVIIPEIDILRKSGIYVENIRIYTKTSSIEYNYGLIYNNPYLKKAVEVTKEQKSPKGRFTKTIVPPEEEVFKDMFKFLTNILKENPQKFFKNYDKQNEFSVLMNQLSQQYVISKNDFSINVEDTEKKLARQLSFYPTFRGICVTRQHMENPKPFKLIKNKPKYELKPSSLTLLKAEEKFPTLEEATQEFNVARSEYLTPEEFEDSYRK